MKRWPNVLTRHRAKLDAQLDLGGFASSALGLASDLSKVLNLSDRLTQLARQQRAGRRQYFGIAHDKFFVPWLDMLITERLNAHMARVIARQPDGDTRRARQLGQVKLKPIYSHASSQPITAISRPTSVGLQALCGPTEGFPLVGLILFCCRVVA